MTKKSAKDKLRRKLAKMRLYEAVLEFIEKLEDPAPHTGLSSEVGEELSEFLELRIMGDEAMPEKITRPAATSKKEETGTKEEPKPSNHAKDEKGHVKPKVDLLAFITKYGRFNLKKVSGTVAEGPHAGEQVTGVAKQVQYPHIMVESDGGGYLPVNPETVKRV